MSKDRNRSPFNLNEEIVDNILNTNNNFVSTLDHLPCDITRSLWLIQTLGLKNNRLKEQLHGILIDERHDELQIRRIQELIERNLREAQQEAKYLVLVLNNHLDTLADDCEILKELKSKLDGWTSEAVEKRWIEWNDFKRAYLEKNSRKQINCSTSKTFKYDNGYDNDYDYDTKMLANENGKPDAKTGSENIVNKKNISISTGSKLVSVSSSTSNGKLKIKLTLKPNGSPDLTTRNRKSSTPSATTNSNNTKRKTSVEVLPNKKLKKEPKNGNLKGTKKEKMRKDIDIENTENRNLEEKAKLTIEPQTGVSTIPPQPIEKYCFCNGPSFGRMVACENERCPHEWFHFKCVGLFKEPEGAWFCSKKCEEQHISFKVSIKKKKKKKRGW